MSEVFLREFEFPADFTEAVKVFEYEVCDKDAAVCEAYIRKGFEYGVSKYSEAIGITVRDRDSATKHSFTKAIVVVRRLNDLIPLTDDCGKLLGFLRSSLGRFEYYVFEARRASQPIGSTESEATSPRPPKEHAIGCHLRAPLACSCVFDGTTTHDAPPSGTSSSEASPDSWWQFPDESKAS